MDDDYVRAVMRFFVHLYEKGWILPGQPDHQLVPVPPDVALRPRLVHVEADDALTHVRYSLVDGDGGIVIATARPATILADVAVAVHPDDERYRELVGREVVVPYVEPRARDRRRPGRARLRHRRAQGDAGPRSPRLRNRTGARAPEPMVIGPDGRMNEAAGDLAGLTQEEAEERILAWLRERDQLEKRESYRHSVAWSAASRGSSRSSRSSGGAGWTSSESRRSRSSRRRVRYHPSPSTGSRSTRSRTHPTGTSPASSGGATSSRSGIAPTGTSWPWERAVCAECGSAELRRDEDVLDTWFSSALWPFATLGGP